MARDVIFKSTSGRKGAEKQFRAAVRYAEMAGVSDIPKSTRSSVSKMRIGELRKQAKALTKSARAQERLNIEAAKDMSAHDAYAEIIKLMPTEKGQDKLRDLDSDDVFKIAEQLIEVDPSKRKGAISAAIRRQYAEDRKEMRRVARTAEYQDLIRRATENPVPYIDISGLKF